MVLDEPNSSLDEAGELALASAIAAASAKGCTFVIVTHRTQILSVCSHLLILNDGAQMMVGPRDEVIAAMKEASEKQQAQRAPAAVADPAALQINASSKGLAA